MTRKIHFSRQPQREIYWQAVRDAHEHFTTTNTMAISQQDYEVQRLINRSMWQEIIDYLPIPIWRNKQQQEIVAFCEEKLGIKPVAIDGEDDFCEDLD